MKRIIITGITGFVGQNLSKYLIDKGHYEIIELNLRKELPLFLPDADAIIHLAGKAHDVRNVSNPEDYFKINFELTQKLFDLFSKSPIKHFIYISSIKAGADFTNEVLNESSSSQPFTPYGKSKLMAEEYIKEFNLPENKIYTILRPCMIHGPNNKGNLNLLYNFISKGIPYPLGAYENKRSFLSIENFCFVIDKLLNKPGLNSDSYVLADDKPLSTKEIVRIIAGTLNKKVLIWYIPKFFITTLAKVGDFLKLPLNSDRLTKLTENYIVDNSKIRTALNIDLPLSAEKGLMITTKSFSN